MVYKANCPECGRRHRFKARPRIYERLVCSQCQTQLAVTNLQPLTMEPTRELEAQIGDTEPLESGQ